MKEVQLKFVQSHEPEGTEGLHYGYKTVVKANGSVWAKIPDSLYEIEKDAGRIVVYSQSIEVPKQPEVVTTVTEGLTSWSEIPIQEQPEETIEQLQEPSAIVVKVDGRTRASKKSK